MTKFDMALEDLKQAGKDLNTAYYMEGYDKKYPNSGLWELVKIAESIGEDVLWKTILVESEIKTEEK